ncbi:MAG: carboxylating nicotinate-nucleotide diphosphorylase, partial [Thermoplasmata archaeon]|nr:carboxylating nicotinate-nucleotide diphosphorylase [Thermoplasmata archaeon]
MAEDRVDRDRTTRALFPRPVPADALVVAQGTGVVSGIAVAEALGKLLGVRVRALRRDGDVVRRGTRVLSIRGDLRRILRGERTLLNYLMHLSGVATATRAAVRASHRGAPGRALAVYGTRKTLPGLRDLEKAAIVHGGGSPHRRDLSSSVLIKNNHLAFLPVEAAVRRARRSVGGSFPIEVEVRGARAAVRAARAGADAVLIDNQSPTAATRILDALERAHLRRSVWV